MANSLAKLLVKVEKTLPPAVAARLRFASQNRNLFDKWGSAMNGQTARLEATRQILYKCRIKQIVETGTFRGTTTEWFAKTGLPVTTIESYPNSYEFSKLRLQPYENVQILLGNSAEHLPSLAANADVNAPSLFYLDAHWEEYLPLKEEITTITNHFKSAVILIDDFQVPQDSGYTFDDYGPGKALTFEYLKTCWHDDMKVFYPSTPSTEETGARRGWVILTTNPDLAETLAGFELLRPA